MKAEDATGENDTPRAIVACASCGATFASYRHMPTQAYRCACEVLDARLTGHFGTTLVDFERYSFDGDRPDWVRDGTICDDCVQRLLDANAMRLVETNVW